MYIRMPQLVKCKAFKSNKENIKQSNGMELTFILEIKLPKEHCFAMFLWFNTLGECIFKPSKDGKKNTYATSYELKSKIFTLNNKNTKQISIELTFTLETRIQNQPFSQKIPIFQLVKSPFLTPVRMRKKDTYATTSEMKSKKISFNNGDIK